MHLLFVCTGNICRSPTAERLAAAHAAQLQNSSLSVASAGTRAVVGHPIHRDAASVLEDLGGDASSFAARQLTPTITAGADLIITMSRTHRDVVLELAPHKLHRTFTITEAAELVRTFGATTIADLASMRSRLERGSAPDITDPIGQRPEVFHRVGSQIAELVPLILELCPSSDRRRTRGTEVE